MVEPEQVVEQLLAAGRREWSDELEAVSGILGAAGVWDVATARRRVFARQLVSRKVTASDVLTWALHGLTTGHGPGWLVRALEADPETIWKARSKGAREKVAGAVNWIRKRQADALVMQVLDSMAARFGGGLGVAVAPAVATLAPSAMVASAAAGARRRLA